MEPRETHYQLEVDELPDANQCCESVTQIADNNVISYLMLFLNFVNFCIAMGLIQSGFIRDTELSVINHGIIVCNMVPIIILILVTLSHIATNISSPLEYQCMIGIIFNILNLILVIVFFAIIASSTKPGIKNYFYKFYDTPGQWYPFITLSVESLCITFIFIIYQLYKYCD